LFPNQREFFLNILTGSVVEPEPKLNCLPEPEPKLRIAAPAPSIYHTLEEIFLEKNHGCLRSFCKFLQFKS
jgi:hypothetical protein